MWLLRLALIGLVLTGCTHWRSVPPVGLEQHKIDLRHCIGVAKGWTPIPAAAVGVSAANTAVAGLSTAATIVSEWQFEQRLGACMATRGYQRAGFTVNLYGWKE